MRLFHKLKIRLYQLLALYIPGARSTRVWLHRSRGVKIGKGVFIGTDVILETEHPESIEIGEGTAISMRVTVIAHFFYRSVRPGRVIIGKKAYIGPGSIVMPGITIGDGAVVGPGSVVSKSVKPYTIVQGNPAKPIAKCRKSMVDADNFYDFLANTEKIN